jgi:hypothetical protein
MKRFLLAITFTFVLSLSALAGETQTPPGEMTGPPGEINSPPGETQGPPGNTQGPAVAGDTQGPSLLETMILTIITWPR